jgi:4-hydroxy-2-oxoglutarate aldolase
MLNGIFPPIATPFINDEISLEKLAFNISKWNEFDLSGYLTMGSNGESAFLTFDEKVKLVSAVKEYAKPGKTIIAGTGSDSIKETIKLTNECAIAGADYGLVLTPSFYKSKMTSEALLNYFRLVADSINIPILIYNVPRFTGINISIHVVAELANHQNIVGIKNTSENIAEISSFVSNTPDDFSVLVGTASVIYPGICAGASGSICALANILPHKCIDLYELSNSGRHSDARELQSKLIEPNSLVTAVYGVSGLKAALDMVGYFGGIPRKPLQPIKPMEVKNLKSVLLKAKLI